MTQFDAGNVSWTAASFTNITGVVYSRDSGKTLAVKTWKRPLKQNETIQFYFKNNKWNVKKVKI